MFENFPLFPDAASTAANQVDAHYYYLVGISTFFSLLIACLVIYFAIKYRRRSKDERPKKIAGSLALELTWSLIPLMLALSIFAWGSSIYFSLRRPPPASLDVYVVGKQWMWKFQHPSGKREINELHVPVGRSVRLTMASEDVIHSFFVPAFRMKYDVVPGRLRTMWFEATKPGKYRLFCAEYCGTKHAGMGGYVIAMEPDEYQDWLSGGERGISPAAAGEKLFLGLGCNTCHRADPTGRGPTLANLFGKQVQLQTGETVLADETYLREAITNPQGKLVAGYQAIMPTYQGLISEEALLQIIAYIKSQSAQPGGASPSQEVPIREP